MRRFLAALYKDLRLFVSGAGLLSLLFPVLLLAGLAILGGDVSLSVQPFPVAVRDEDGTIMSRTLISQMEGIGLFSEVRLLSGAETDEEAIKEGAAAAVTIPKDLFYRLYNMDQEPVTVTLNSSMKLESALFKSVFCSVMDIVKANQASAKGLYSFCYGKSGSEAQEAMYREASNNLVMDALSRQAVFDTEASAADVKASVKSRTAACVLSVAALFFALSAVKAVPEEKELGVLPRYVSLGGSTAAFIFSKLLTVLLVSIPAALLIAYLFSWGAIVVAAVLIFGAFGIMLAAAAFTGSPSSVLRTGNLLILLSCASALWPSDTFLSKLFFPYYARLGLEAFGKGLGIKVLLVFLFPVTAAGILGLVIAIPGLSRIKTKAAPKKSEAPVTASAGLKGTASRLSGLSVVKLKACSGGIKGIAALIIVAAAGGLMSKGESVGLLKLTVCDLDKTGLSEELVTLISGQEGLELEFTEKPGLSAGLLLGETEGVLTIEKGYSESVSNDGGPKLHYESASSSFSAEGARELIAGQAAAQKSYERAYRLASEILKRELTESDKKRLSEEISKAENGLKEIYEIKDGKGMETKPPFMPGPVEFMAFAVLMTLFTVAPWSGEEGKKAEFRMLALPKGKLLYRGSEWLALSFTGLIAAAAVLVSGGRLNAFPAAAVYVLCVSSIAMPVSKPGAASGKVDVFAPFLALSLCLIGGCFIDLGQFSPAISKLAMATPTGLVIKAAEGSAAAVMGLIAETGLALQLEIWK